MLSIVPFKLSLLFGMKSTMIYDGSCEPEARHVRRSRLLVRLFEDGRTTGLCERQVAEHSTFLPARAEVARSLLSLSATSVRARLSFRFEHGRATETSCSGVPLLVKRGTFDRRGTLSQRRPPAASSGASSMNNAHSCGSCRTSYGPHSRRTTSPNRWLT